MSSRIRRLDPGLRLNDRILVPVQRLARMAGVSPAEIIEFLLEEIFEGEVVPPEAVAPPARPRAPIIPITRARGFQRAGHALDLSALRHQAQDLRCRAREARQRADAARQAAGAAREKSARALADLGSEAIRLAPARR